MFFNKESDQREQKFRSLCASFEKKYLGSDEFGMHSYLKYFNVYHRNGKISNLCHSSSGMNDTIIYLFDYKYSVQMGNARKVIKQTIFLVLDRNMFLPVFAMKPEHLGHKIGSFFGWEDIDFEANPEFSEQYHLTGNDEDWIRDNFKDTVLSFFSKSSGWHVEAANHFMIFFAHNTQIPENILFDFYKMGIHVHKLFKESQKELKEI
jgi:hypothetical protein